MNIDEFNGLLQNLYGFDLVKQDMVEYDKLQKLYEFDGITQDALVHPPPQRLPAAIGAPPQVRSDLLIYIYIRIPIQNTVGDKPRTGMP